MMNNYYFDRISEGETVTIKGLPGVHDEMPITINKFATTPPLAPSPFEIFIQYDSPEHFELINVISRLSSMALREGVPLDIIANELKDIHSPLTNHMVLGTSRKCPSITARIGEALEDYSKQQQNN